MPGKKKEKKAKSRSQQRLFGMVTAYNNGKLDLDKLPASLAKKIKETADGKRRKTGDKRTKTKGITKKAAAELASTKHKGKPERVSENKTLRFEELQKLKNTMKIKKFNEELESTGNVVLGDKVEGYMDALEGGEAQGMTIEDIADKHNVPVEYIEIILTAAIEIEMEHTDDPDVAERIVLDHLTETPLYYDEKLGLPNMEEELEEVEEGEVKKVVTRVLNGKKVKKYQDEEKLEDTVEESEEAEEELEEVQESVKKFDIFKLEESLFAKLSDFVDEPGETEIWYEKGINFDSWDFREKMYNDSTTEEEYLNRYGERINPKNLKNTHALLGTIKETEPEKIFHLLNTWGNGEETNSFLQNKRVGHTSMSVGDIIKIGDEVFFVDDIGFKNITNE